MNKFSIASVIVLLIIALMPSVSAAGIDNAPPTTLKNDVPNNNNGIYDYDAQISQNVVVPAGSTYIFRLENVGAPALQQGNVDVDKIIRIRWTPTRADVGTRNYILEVADNANNPLASTERFPITIEGAKISVSNVLLGGPGSDGERFNNDADDFNSAAPKPKKAKDLTITNTGDLPATIQSVAINTQLDAQLPTQDIAAYDLAITNQNQLNNFPIGAGETKLVNVAGVLVETLPAIDDKVNLDELKVWNVGKVTVAMAVIDRLVPVQGDGLVQMRAQNMLEVKKIEVCASGATERCKRYDKGDTVENLKPNDKLSITVIVENNFDDKSNLDMDVKVEIDTDDTDVIDLDENDEEDSVETNTETEFELSAAIEDDADGTGTLTIRVSGEDDNKALHGEKWDLKFKVEREAHEIAISSIRMNPTLVSCNQGSRDIQLEVEVRNIGKKKEREVKVEISADRGHFKLQKSESDIEVDKNDELPVRFTFTVPVEVEPGTYPIEVNTYTKRTLLSESETTTLTVPDCGFVVPASEPEQQDEQKREDEVVVTAPSAGTAASAPAGTVATATPVAKKATKTFTASNAYIGALVAIIVVLLVIGGILVAMIVRKQ